MIELSILRLFIKDKAIYIKYIDILNKVILEKELKLIYNLIERYYTKFPEHNYIAQDELLNWFHLEYPTHREPAFIEKLISQIYSLDTSREMGQELLLKLVEKDYANKMAQHLLPIIQGESSGTNFELLRELLTQYEEQAQLANENESPFVEDSLDDLLIQTESDGLRWRLECFNKHLGPLSGGTLGHGFGRPEIGKTSLIHSEVSFIAPQLDNGDCILWCNNEEAGARVKLRLYCAITGMSEAEIRMNPKLAAERFNANGGQRVKLYDDAMLTVHGIEALCRDYKPRLVIIDQGDKVSYRGDSKAGNGADRLKGVYDKLREVVKRCNNEWKMDMLTVGQADIDAENKKRLTMRNLDSGKTGKAGAFDYVIGIGALLDEEDVRYISFCKNKLKGYHGTNMVNFSQATGRYSD